MRDAMDYAYLRSAPLLRFLVNMKARKALAMITIVTIDEQVFHESSQERQAEPKEVRSSPYFEALC